MNVLVTAAGRRTYLITALRDALGTSGLVLACDMSVDAPALQEADGHFVVPNAAEAAAYLASLLQICEEHRVGLLIPGLEQELPLLAAHAACFATIGTVVIVSSLQVVDTCFDKLRAARFLRNCGLSAPRTWTTLESARRDIARGQLTFPVVVKPRWGVGSIGLAFPDDDEELGWSYSLTRRVIDRSILGSIGATDPTRCVLIQERLAGEEYGLDIINDLHGRHACTFVKRKLRMRAGQTDRAVTVDDERIRRVGERIGAALGHVAVLDCDAVVTAEDVFVLDLNPRIGGGYPFSHVAGANVPAALVAWARGAEADPDWFRIRPNVQASRSDHFVVMAGA